MTALNRPLILGSPLFNDYFPIPRLTIIEESLFPEDGDSKWEAIPVLPPESPERDFEFHSLQIQPCLEEREEKVKSSESEGLVPWRRRIIDIETSMIKMMKNTQKALLEHRQINKEYAAYYASTEDPVLGNMPALLPSLQLSHVVTSMQGLRTTMEDAHFYLEIEQGIITGVMDGHGNEEALKLSNFVSNMFQQNFSDYLKQCNNNVHQCFEHLIHRIQFFVKGMKVFGGCGCTVVVCFIQKSTNRIYTATLGDSEANIYRKDAAGQTKSIPLSCVRDWNSKKDHERGLKAEGFYFNMKKAKPRIVHRSYGSTNISRAIGDVKFTPIIHKPKITVHLLRPGDELVIACDGLRDFVNENEIITLIGRNAPGGDLAGFSLADLLVNYSLNIKNSTDNVTVLAVKIR